MPVTEGRVPSSAASQRTRRRRTLQLARVRGIISGGSPTEQMAAEVQSLSVERKEELLKEASLPLVIPADHGLAIKTTNRFTWKQMRGVRR